MAIRASKFQILSAAIAIVASGLAAPAPAVADEDPHYRPQPKQQRVIQRERVRTVVQPVERERVRTVVRVRTRTICYDYSGQQFDCRNPAPVAPQPVYYGCGGCAPAAAPVQQYYVQEPAAAPVYAPAYSYQPSCGGCAPAVAVAPVQRTYATGCGGCGQQVMPYAWQQRYHHRQAYYDYR